MKIRMPRSLLAIFSFLVPAFAQTQDPSAEEIYSLTPFEVNSTGDEGYRASNTLTGSRLDTALRDTPAAISVMTEEFLDDIGATDLASMLAYDINAEAEFNDGDFGGDSNEDNLTANGAAFRSRGIGGSVATDGFRAAGVADSYNLERIGLSRGPNAILFGVGSPGGVVNFRTKRATPYKATNEIELRVGSYGLRRATVDFNRPLIKDKLALRVLGLWQEKDDFRPFLGGDKKSGTITTSFRPFKNTHLNASYEVSEEFNVTSRRWGPIDRISKFQSLIDNGQVGFDPSDHQYKFFDPNGGFGKAVTNAEGGLANQNYRALIVLNSHNDQALLWEGDGANGAGIINNQTYRVTNQSIVNGNNQPSDVPSLFPIGVTTPTGYAESGDVDVKKLTVTLSQKIIEGMFVELAYNKSSRLAGGIIGRNPSIRADLTYELDDGTLNPYHFSNGYYAIDQQYLRLIRSNDDETKRISLSYETNLKKLGQHRFAILAEEHEAHDIRERAWLVWDDKAIHPNQNPENTNNRVNIRNYFKIGDDYSTIRAGALPDMVNGGHSFPSVNRNADITTGFARNRDTDDIVSTDTRMFVMQNYFFNRRLVTTYGYRQDDLSTDERTTIRDPESDKWRFTTPADLDANLTDALSERFSTSGNRQSIGAVWHLNQNFSFTANSSEGMQLAQRNRTVLPYFLVPETVEGEGQDYGLNFSFLDNRISGSFRYFQSSALRDASNWNGSAFVDPNNDIIQTFQSVFAGTGQTNPTPIEDLSGAGLSDLTYVNPGENYSINSSSDLDPLIYNGSVKFLADRSSSGYELEILGRITDNWDVRIAASHTDYSRVNVLSEGDDWWAERLNLYQELDSYWMSLDSSNQSIIKGLLVDEEGVQDVNRTVEDRIAESDEELVRERIEQSQGFGSRPWKFNAWTRYRFYDGRLKGLTFGGGLRYQSKNIAGIDLANNQLLHGAANTMVDFMAAYRTNSFFGNEKMKVTYQVNISNLFDADTYLSTKIWTTDTTNEPYTKRGYQVDPRQINFTIRTEF